MNFIKRIMMLAIAVLCLSFAAKAEYKIFVEDFEMTPGEQKKVAIKMNNESPVCAFQFEIYLPEGLSFTEKSAGRYNVSLNSERNDEHTFSVNVVEDGSMRVLCYNINAYDLLGSSGDDLCYVTLAASENFVGGTIRLAGIVMTHNNSTKFDCANETTAIVTIPEETGVEETLAEGGAAEYYTIDGVKVAKENLTQGVYVKKVGNKASKVLVK